MIVEFFKKWFYPEQEEPRVTCVHGSIVKQRTELAADIFLDKVQWCNEAVIACHTKNIVPILTALGFEVDENARWWRGERKLQYGQMLLDQRWGNVRFCSTGGDADLVWMDGQTCDANAESVIVFSGSLVDEPFISERRRTHIRGKNVARSGITLPGQYCTGWTCGR